MQDMAKYVLIKKTIFYILKLFKIKYMKICKKYINIYKIYNITKYIIINMCIFRTLDKTFYFDLTFHTICFLKKYTYYIKIKCL